VLRENLAGLEGSVQFEFTRALTAHRACTCDRMHRDLHRWIGTRESRTSDFAEFEYFEFGDFVEDTRSGILQVVRIDRSLEGPNPLWGCTGNGVGGGPVVPDGLVQMRQAPRVRLEAPPQVDRHAGVEAAARRMEAVQSRHLRPAERLQRGLYGYGPGSRERVV